MGPALTLFLVVFATPAVLTGVGCVHSGTGGVLTEDPSICFQHLPVGLWRLKKTSRRVRIPERAASPDGPGGLPDAPRSPFHTRVSEGRCSQIKRLHATKQSLTSVNPAGSARTSSSLASVSRARCFLKKCPHAAPAVVIIQKD